MRHNYKYNKIKKINSHRGKISQSVQNNDRLSVALDYGPIRSAKSYLVFDIRTRNARTGVEHLIEIKHEIDNGNNRYNVYLDDVKWHKPWSRTAFCKWLFDRIDAVKIDWA